MALILPEAFPIRDHGSYSIVFTAEGLLLIMTIIFLCLLHLFHPDSAEKSLQVTKKLTGWFLLSISINLYLNYPGIFILHLTGN